MATLGLDLNTIEGGGTEIFKTIRRPARAAISAKPANWSLGKRASILPCPAFDQSPLWTVKAEAQHVA